MYTKICSSVRQFEADLIIVALRENGFNPLDLSTSPHVQLAGCDQAYYVELPDSEAEEAREFLKQNGHEKDLV